MEWLCCLLLAYFHSRLQKWPRPWGSRNEWRAQFLGFPVAQNSWKHWWGNPWRSNHKFGISDRDLVVKARLYRRSNLRERSSHPEHPQARSSRYQTNFGNCFNRAHVQTFGVICKDKALISTHFVQDIDVYPRWILLGSGDKGPNGASLHLPV